MPRLFDPSHRSEPLRRGDGHWATRAHAIGRLPRKGHGEYLNLANFRRRE